MKFALNFITSLKGGMHLTKHYVTFYKRSITIPTQHLIDYNQSALAKRGGPIDEIASFNIKKK